MQNPPDLSFDTYKLVRFTEHNGPTTNPVWYFFPDQCRHCVEPGCLSESYAVPNSIFVDNLTGAVLFTDKLKGVPFEDVRGACPYDIPRKEAQTGYMSKCTMCVERVYNGLLPACVKTCPTGAMAFGDLDQMVSMALKRLEEVKPVHPKARVLDLNDVRVFYLVADDPKKYHVFADARSVPGLMDRKIAMKKIGRSLKELALQRRFIRRMDV
jgi:formate dehydrogenase iron-sulfur subunit